MTQTTQTRRRNGCYNHAPYVDTVVVPDGFEIIRNGFGEPFRQPKFSDIPNPMSRGCQYSKAPEQHAGPGCVGCIWHAQPQLAGLPA